MSDRGNPLLEVHTESHRTTINNVPVHRLHGHLPPPVACDDCGYGQTWFLIDPDAVNGSDESERGELVMVSEFSLECVNPAVRKQMGALAMAPMCGHPYHLVTHRCEPGKPRVEVPIPAGLIVRPT